MSMKRSDNLHHPYLRSLVWFAGAAFCLVSLVGAPVLQSFLPLDHRTRVNLRSASKDMARLGLETTLDKEALNDLAEYQRITGKTLAQVLREPGWAAKFGFSTTQFKATWYIANPYELLPADLQQAIRNKKTPFKTNAQVWEWCRSKKAPAAWKKALKTALVETTPHNLWRASRGQQPYVKNGEFLKPIVIEHAEGIYEVKDGHIATDPRIIPTNTVVLMLVKVDGKERILKVKAADIGGAIKGKHVDLPIHLDIASKGILPNVLLPKEYIRNPVVQILIPKSAKVNPSRKA